MAKVDRSKFIEFVKRSRLVEAEPFRSALGEFARLPPQPGHTADAADAHPLADFLVEKGVVNRWQANHLLDGKYKGFTLGKYRLLGHLGTGGMSSVYLAEHPVMERRVAIKVLPRKNVKNPNYLDRFRREARAVAALDHPNIVRAYDIDNEGDAHFLVMEYVEGRDLQRIVDQDGPCPVDFAADCIFQVAVGLEYAHSQGLIHRDVKPANCLVDLQSTVKILDLGLAKFSSEDRPALSKIYNDSVVGTADYLAPEQAVNSQTVDSRADIYSLGCTLYFLLTGHPPFPTGTLAERLLKHQRETPKSIYKDRPDVPPALVDVCQRMMAKEKEQRIQTAGEVAHALAAWLASRGKPVRPWESSPAARGPATASGDWHMSIGEGSGRLQEWPASSPAASSTTNAAETRSARDADSDTDRISTRDDNDELTLAPLEDEQLSSSDLLGRATGRKTGRADAPDPAGSDLDANADAVESLTHVLSPLESKVDHEPDITDTAVMRRLSPRKRDEFQWSDIPGPIWAIFVLVALVLVFFLAGGLQ